MERTPHKVKQVPCKCLDSRSDQLTSVMTSLTEKLVGEGIGQYMGYKEYSMHNSLAFGHNTAMSAA